MSDVGDAARALLAAATETDGTAASLAEVAASLQTARTHTILANVACFLVFGGSPSADDLASAARLRREYVIDVLGVTASTGGATGAAPGQGFDAGDLDPHEVEQALEAARTSTGAPGPTGRTRRSWRGSTAATPDRGRASC